jgi:hypothetical protein
MYAVEFETTIKNGIVYIPREYKDLQEKQKVRFLIMYDSDDEYKINTRKRKKEANKGTGKLSGKLLKILFLFCSIVLRKF